MNNSFESLRTLRKACNRSLSEIATILNVTVQAVSRYEKGERQINIRQVLTLAEVYDCTAEEIIHAQLNSYQYGQ